MAGVEQLKLDLEEIKRLIPLAARQRIKGVLSVEMSRIEAEIAQLQLSSARSGDDATTSKPKKEQKPATKELSTVTIKTYGWDQSDKFVKIYVTINGVQSIPASDVTVEFNQQSFKLLVRGLNGSNHQLSILGLLSSILPTGSHYKVKTDSVVIFLKKQQQSQKWAYLTQAEQRIKDKGKPQAKPEVAADPNGGVMDMMKKMYDEGDDEMKRTIAKAWTESKDKQGQGMGGMGMGGMGMGGMGGMDMGGMGMDMGM